MVYKQSSTRLQSKENIYECNFEIYTLSNSNVSRSTF